MTQEARPATTMDPAREQQLRQLARRLGHEFGDLELLDRGLTHASAANEDLSGSARDNEAFEFLGDAVIAFLTADFLHRRDPEGPEGRKSRLKALLVSEPRLACRADALGIPASLRLGRGEEKTGGREKQALWADAYEAVVAAIYLDGGVEAAARFVNAALAAELADGQRLPTRDAKSALQETLQARGLPVPDYVVVSQEGPAHRLRFRVECRIAGESLAAGEGFSKKEAQQEAAHGALGVVRARQARLERGSAASADGSEPSPAAEPAPEPR
jgi:ribonuclease-3